MKVSFMIAFFTMKVSFMIAFFTMKVSFMIVFFTLKVSFLLVSIGVAVTVPMLWSSCATTYYGVVLCHESCSCEINGP